MVDDRPGDVGGVRVVVAPDKFKGTLSGPAAAAAMAVGVRAVLPDAVVDEIPLADGGEGTVEAILATGATEHRLTVPGPLGDPVEAQFAMLGTTAVIESAQACGLQLISPTPRTSLRASSAGVGALIRAAWDAGATSVAIGLGGVACTDGGTGLVAELGARFVDADGEVVGPGELDRVVSVDLTGLDPRVTSTSFVAATDVTNPLLGPTGAAAVYGPQKGAGPDEVALLDQGLATVANVVESAVDGEPLRERPGAGAAGGLGWGLMALLGAEVRPGGDLVMDLIGLPDALKQADLVLTGEGKLDAQSRYGKGPVALAELAATHGLPTIAVAGMVDPEGREGTGFAAVWSLVEEVGGEAALHETAASLTEVTAGAVRHWREQR
ncbi:glycerate kinase [Ornithinimicrobium faecis]|uniref:Glycerate kinase n=1 Tax=Ornithinimicrobium faecis TaxID=2934158 RepID=A0ABY4YY12_9MICO|nr:glycerate kinase [Ornithinimicrobium sp. HY1793]USQ81631.1 glycerate kinase [Ornithinimicrobium sp. HY1793]